MANKNRALTREERKKTRTRRKCASSPVYHHLLASTPPPPQKKKLPRPLLFARHLCVIASHLIPPTLRPLGFWPRPNGGGLQRNRCLLKKASDITRIAGAFLLQLNPKPKKGMAGRHRHRFVCLWSGAEWRGPASRF